MVNHLDKISNYPAFFQNKVLVNVCYWNDYVKRQRDNMPTLEQERERILIALVFALNLASAWPDVFELISNFASFMERQGQWSAWQRVLKQALDIAEQCEDRAAMATLYALLARLAQRQSQPKQTIYYYRQTIKLARATGELFEEARACSNLGYLFTEQGYWPRAEVLCCRALALFEQINSDHGRAHTHNHLGILYTRQRRWPQAQQHLEQACAIWKIMGDKHGLMYGLINVSLLYNDVEYPDKSLYHLEKALHLAELTGDEVLVGTIYMNIGVAYRLGGDPTRAEVYARQAEAIFKKFANLQSLAEVWHNLGLAYMDQRDWGRAWQYLKAALESWCNLKHEYGEIRTLVCMVECELAQGHNFQAIARVNELEQLDYKKNWAKRYPNLQELLLKHRVALVEQTS